VTTAPEDVAAGLLGDELLALLAELDEDALIDAVNALPAGTIDALLKTTATIEQISLPPGPLELALSMDGAGFRERAHLAYLSSRLARAVQDVASGTSRILTVSMPPRAGKSTLTSFWFPLWLLQAHPDWSIGMISHDGTLVGGWALRIRRTIEERSELGIELAPDFGATSVWQTEVGGGVLARSVGSAVVGRGFKVLLLDDVVKDFVTAHSSRHREVIWNKWLADYFTRLEGPYLVIAIGTRWHEDDFIGRLLSKDHEGDPDEIERIDFPAIATEADALGRAPGEPLISPLQEETTAEALQRWSEIQAAVGSYMWAALYQQSPAPAAGAIFNTDWFRFWTSDPERLDPTDPDSKVSYFNPAETPPSAVWLDSWDMAFKGEATSDYVVGQRWVKLGKRKYLIAQSRDRRTFTETLAEFRQFSSATPYATRVTRSLVEDKANGTAVLDVMKDEFTGLEPVTPVDNKEARARSVTPDFERGEVWLPHPQDPGNEWVPKYLSELRTFPSGAHDDQADATTQALMDLRDAVPASLDPVRGAGERGRECRAGRGGERLPGEPRHFSGDARRGSSGTFCT
jgi:predicted phage terminase large subunit-like protein